MTELIPIGLILPAAFALDLLLGDSPSFPHPVRWMGKAIATLEPHFRKISSNQVLCGVLFAVSLISGTWVLTYCVIKTAVGINPWFGCGIEIIVIYFCISARSLADAA